MVFLPEIIAFVFVFSTMYLFGFADFDECKLDSTCSQKCHNTEGSYKCSCVEGYMLKSDGRGCKALGMSFLYHHANPAIFVYLFPIVKIE